MDEERKKELAELEGVVYEDGRVRAKMVRNAKGGSVNRDEDR